MLVTLDSGHYGKYNRSPANRDFYESNFNWKMTNYMADYFKQYGVKVKLTRENLNKDLALFDRGLMAKGSDIFLSIHANACDDEKVDYPVVIRGYNESSTDKLALSLAMKIEEIMDTRQEGRTYIRKKTTRNEEYYGVLRGAKAAGVKYRFIIEHSFYTNKKAVNFLLNDNNIKKLAKAEVEIIVNYFSIKNGEKQVPSTLKKTHYIKVLQNNLSVRKVADWKAKPCQIVTKGDVFTVVDTVEAKNGTVKMYKLKSGLYITTHHYYVDSFYK